MIIRVENREPGDEIGLTLKHDGLLVHNVFLLTRVDNVNLLQLLHRVRARVVLAEAYLILHKITNKLAPDK